MIKLWAVLIGVLFTPKTQVLNVAEVTKLLDSSVVIRAKEAMQTENGIRIGMIGCSGTFVSTNTVLTAAHCFQSPATAIWVRGPKGGSHRAYIERLDFARDLALLNVVGPKHVAIKLAKTPPRMGEAVTNIGSPFFFEFLVSEGTVASTRLKFKEFKSHYTVTTAMINSGSSGGGAFNDKGELIGVNTMTVGGMMGWAGISLAVSLEDIKDFLK